MRKETLRKGFLCSSGSSGRLNGSSATGKPKLALVSCDEGTLTQSSAIQALEIAIGDVSLDSNIPFMFLFPNDFVCRSIIKGNFSYSSNFSAIEILGDSDVGDIVMLVT